MTKLPWLLLLFALLGAATLAYVIRTSAARGPADYLDAARAHLEEDPQDVQGAFRELHFGVELAQRLGDQTLLAELLDERGRLSLRRGAYSNAEADFLALLDNEFYERNDALRQLAEMDLALDNYDSAEARVEAILADDPNNSRVEVLRGQIHRERLDLAWGSVETLIEDELPDEASDIAVGLAERVVYLPQDAPLRATLQNELDLLLSGSSDSSKSELRTLVDEASDIAAVVRGDFEVAVGRWANATAAFNLFDLLQRAGRHQDVVDLGLALRRFDGVAGNRDCMQLLTESLSQVDRNDLAETVVETTLPAQGGVWMDQDFLPTWARIVYENQSWARLAWVADELADRFKAGDASLPQRQAALFYRGIALSNGVNRQAGSSHLSRFVADRPDVEPVPGAIGEAWWTLADLARDREDWDSFRTALQSCVREAPDYSGEAWRLLAEFRIERNTPLEQPLVELTHALALLPHRTAELLPRWIEIGDRSLLEADRDLDLIYRKVLARGEWYDTESRNPYERYRLAEMHLAAGAEGGAINVCRKLLKDYPNLLPANDLLIDVYRTLNRLDLMVPLLLARLADVPNAAKTLAELRELEHAGRLTPDQLLALMRLDPHYTGVLVLGRELLETGQAELASQALAEADPATLGTPGRLLAAEIDLARGRPERVMQHLATIVPTDPQFASAVRLRVAAATALGQTDRLAKVLAGVSQAEALDPDEVLKVTQQLLLERQWQPALMLLERLDQLPSSRSGEVVAQLALAHLQGRQASSARDALERLLAFRDDGVAEMGELLMAVQERRWTDLANRVRALRSTSYTPSPLGACLLAALEERLEEANLLAIDGLIESGQSARWALALRAIQFLRSETPAPWSELGREGTVQTANFLRGSAEDPKDPRRALAILMALEFDEWSIWAMAELGNLTADPAGALWPTYLAAEANLRLGRDGDAAVLLEALTTVFPRFSSAWDLLLSIETERLLRPEHPKLLRLRAARAAALGAPDEESVDATLAQALQEESAGRLPRAKALVSKVLEQRPRHLAAQLIMGRLQQSTGDFADAVATYGGFFRAADRELAFEYAPAFLSALDFADRTDAIAPSVYSAELLALSARLPDDPLVVLARARYEIDHQRESLQIGIGRAWLLLDQFRERTGGVAIDRLRAGTSRAWAELLATYAPKRAEAFVESELALLPQSLDLWLMMGEVYEIEGRRLDAAAHYEIVRAMVPSPAAILSAARLQATLGRNPERVTSMLVSIRRMENRPADDPALALIRAQSLINSPDSDLEEGLRILRELWKDREANADRLAVPDLARIFALAMLHHGSPPDRSTTKAAVQVLLETESDPLRLEILEILLSYATKIPAPPAEEKPDAGDSGDESAAAEPAAPAANGSAANGSAANGSAANGSAKDGSAKDGSAKDESPHSDPSNTPAVADSKVAAGAGS
ncbi:hypothetical protein [Engelhardtia mirabilis]|uniref:Tetratricopeptide repeat protein n=1 Tax=Engelhardtia mirabilis TaxID=2528011 RepID=A0A518BKG8_9BACT|nr:tetratricopeptide repeat protein [Planctomycetes bacterium Pla133]QDV01759.1 tetratricopeptide repeat protein [Planctomycetes bacterium Pla86]